MIGCGPLCLLSNQFVGFFDHQYFGKELRDTVDLLHGDNHQCKEGSETYHLWLDVASCTSCPIRLQDCLIINISGNN